MQNVKQICTSHSEKRSLLLCTHTHTHTHHTHRYTHTLDQNWPQVPLLLSAREGFTVELHSRQSFYVCKKARPFRAATLNQRHKRRLLTWTSSNRPAHPLVLQGLDWANTKRIFMLFCRESWWLKEYFFLSRSFSLASPPSPIILFMFFKLSPFLLSLSGFPRSLLHSGKTPEGMISMAICRVGRMHTRRRKFLKMYGMISPFKKW